MGRARGLDNATTIDRFAAVLGTHRGNADHQPLLADPPTSSGKEQAMGLRAQLDSDYQPTLATLVEYYRYLDRPLLQHLLVALAGELADSAYKKRWQMYSLDVAETLGIVSDESAVVVIEPLQDRRERLHLCAEAAEHGGDLGHLLPRSETECQRKISASPDKKSWSRANVGDWNQADTEDSLPEHLRLCSQCASVAGDFPETENSTVTRMPQLFPKLQARGLLLHAKAEIQEELEKQLRTRAITSASDTAKLDEIVDSGYRTALTTVFLDEASENPHLPLERIITPREADELEAILMPLPEDVRPDWRELLSRDDWQEQIAAQVSFVGNVPARFPLPYQNITSSQEATEIRQQHLMELLCSRALEAVDKA